MKEITLDDFKKEIKSIDVVDNRWKNKMLMVKKLFEAQGYGLKDVNDEALINMYAYISDMLKEILTPTIVDFYRYKTLENEARDVNAIKSRLTPENMKKFFLEHKTSDTEDCSKNLEENVMDVYMDLVLPVLNRIVHNPKSVSIFVDFMEKKYGMDITKKLIDGLDKESDMLEQFYLFYSESPVGQKTIENAFIEEVTACKKYMANEIRSGLVNRILTTTKFFNDCGYLAEMMEINNGYMDKFKIPAMKVSMDENKENFNILKLTSPEYLSQFTTEELFILSSYYTNRLEKIVDNAFDGIYLHMKLQTFYDTIAYGEIPEKYTTEDAKTVLRQKGFIDMLARKGFGEIKQRAETGEVEERSLLELPADVIAKYSAVYKRYFDRYIPDCPNDLEIDYKIEFYKMSQSYVMYVLKDFSIESFLYTLSENKSKINFGLIKEDKKIRNQYGEEQILIGVDYKEFPTIRLHFPRREFEEFVDEFFPDKDFPVYLGNDDLKINETEMKNHVAYKFTKAQKQAIKLQYDTMDKNSSAYKFVRHMYWNIHPNQHPINKRKSKKHDSDINN